ncbi:MAG: hypothetical protein R2729_29305 [Bryobacteraceae bacterium]
MKIRRLTYALLLAGWTFAAPPPEEVIESATGYMEWMLDVRFTAPQRARYQGILESTLAAPNGGAGEAVSAMARTYDHLGTMSPSDKSALREKACGEFTRLLREASDPDSRWLLRIYDSRRPGPSPSALTGRWTNGRVSLLQYRDAYTGASAPTNGSSFRWEFRTDGTYSFTGLLQNVLYNCTTAMFSTETGTFTVEGGALVLRPEKNPYRFTNTCAPSSNKEGPGKLTVRSYRFRVVKTGANENLELVGDDGAVQTFARQR